MSRQPAELRLTKRAIMHPQLIGTFPALGNDGNLCTVQVWMTFRLAERTQYDTADRWIPNAHAEIDTFEGDEGTEWAGGELRIPTLGMYLISDDPTRDEVSAAFQARYRALMGYRNPQ